MSCLQTLRNARWLSRFVLVWFALCIGVAVASPLVKPVDSQMVCSAMGGVTLVVGSEDGLAAHLSAKMDCPLCAPMGSPAVTRKAQTFAPSSALVQTMAHREWVAAVGLSGRALPPRGPPA